MKLFIFRHGKAKAFAEGGDAERELSDQGRAAMEIAAEVWAERFPAPTCVVSSPFVRARQTAEILLERWKPRQAQLRLEFEEELVPWGNITLALERLPDEASVCLVSHMPFVGDFAARILSGSDTGEIWFKTGMGMYCEYEPLSESAKLLASLCTDEAKRFRTGNP